MSKARTRQAAGGSLSLSLSLGPLTQRIPVIASLLLFIVATLSLVSLRLETTRLQTLLVNLEIQRNELVVQTDQLKTERGYRINPDELEKRARALGLVLPKTDEILTLDE